MTKTIMIIRPEHVQTYTDDTGRIIGYEVTFEDPPTLRSGDSIEVQVTLPGGRVSGDAWVSGYARVSGDAPATHPPVDDTTETTP